MATCDDVLSIGDDFGDNEASFTCQRDEAHIGNHEEVTTWEDGTVFVMMWMRTPSKESAEVLAESLRSAGEFWEANV